MYGSNSLASKQAELHAKKHAHAKRKRFLLSVLFFVLAFLFFYLIRQPFLRINSVTVSGSTLVDADDVDLFIKEKLNGYRFFLIPRNSIVFLKRSALESAILDKFTRLSKVSISGTRDLSVNLYEPSYSKMYCNLTVSEAQTSPVPQNCALLHTDGKLGSLAPKYSYSPFFTFYKTIDNLPELGTRIIDYYSLNRISLISSEVESYDIPVSGFVFGEEYDEILLNTGDAFSELPRIRILPGATAEDISKTLEIAARDSSVQKLLIDNIKDLHYIDLRFSGQVVYKKRGEE